MLVLSRKVGQSLRIGDDVLVKVVEVRGQQVRLGIEAPEEVSITREEIAEERGSRHADAGEDIDQAGRLSGEGR